MPRNFARCWAQGSWRSPIGHQSWTVSDPGHEAPVERWIEVYLRQEWQRLAWLFLKNSRAAMENPRAEARELRLVRLPAPPKLAAANGA